jgi:hypothetical protein
LVRKPPGPRGSGIITDRISLRNHIDLDCRPASFRTIRGITSVAIIAEEISTWLSDESLNPDVEILNAARPALATTGGPMIAIGSPRARKGETWRTFKRHFGATGNPAILVANGPTKLFNPAIKQSVIDRAYEDDPAVAASEWGGQFRNDLETYVNPDVVDDCTDTGVLCRPYERRLHYFAHADPAGGSGADSFTLALGHVEEEMASSMFCSNSVRPSIRKAMSLRSAMFSSAMACTKSPGIATPPASMLKYSAGTMSNIVRLSRR